MQVAYKSNEVTPPRVKCADCWNRISLRSRRVRKIPDRFKTNHSGDLVAANFATSRVNETAHLRCLEVGRLFVHERDEAQRARCRSCGEMPRQCQQRSHSASVVVRTRRTDHRIVMCADENDLRGSALNFRLDVMTRQSIYLVCISP